MLLEHLKVHVTGTAAHFEHEIILSIALLKVEYLDSLQDALVDSEFINAIPIECLRASHRAHICLLKSMECAIIRVRVILKFRMF
jgi:hypothetical protein